MKTADLPQETEKLSHTLEYPATPTYLLHVTDKLSHNPVPGENYRPATGH